jgi:hypothetical protein
MNLTEALFPSYPQCAAERTNRVRSISCLPVAVTTLAVLISLTASEFAEAQTFSNVTSAAGINHTQFATPPAFYEFSEERIQTGGVAARDYDGDGYVDLFFTRMDAPDLLYHNQGNGTFSVVDPSVSGINRGIGSNGAAWGDINRDGKPDLYITTVDQPRNFLYVNNGDGTFTEQALARGVDVTGKGGAFSPAFGDYDGDGYLDMFTTSWRDVAGTGNRLFHNQGAANPGHFTDATVSAGVDMSQQTSYQGITNASFGFSPHFSDLNGDGLVDLAVTGDFDTSRLYYNNGDGTFTDATDAAGVGVDSNGMGSAIGDYNGDGHLDWFVSSIWDESIPNNAGWHGNGSQLYTNNGDGTFTAEAFNTGWGWGSSFLDFDNDGHLDLAVTNGFDVPDQLTTIDNDFNHDPTMLYHNDNGVLNNVATAEGVTDMDSGKGLAVLDYDNDGKLDLVVVNNQGAPILYHNQSTLLNDWIGFDTVGTASNIDGFGAMITITENGVSQIFEISGGSNYLSQNDKRAHFGLGDSDGVLDSVSIMWPSGISQAFSNLPSNQYYTINESLGLIPLLTVPEPSTVVLAVLGAAALGIAGRRRRKRAPKPLFIQQHAKRLGLFACAVACLSAQAMADTITDWNTVLTQTVRETATTHGVNAGPGPVARSGAMMFAAMYDAVNSVDQTNQPYLTSINVPAGTSREAAAATAAYRVMTSLYTGTTQVDRFNAQLAHDLGAIPDSPGKDAGIALGMAVADNLIAHRTGDGSGVLTPYALNPAAGYWRPAFGQTPITPGWGNVTPFTMTSGSQFRPDSPGGFSDMQSLLASPEYAAQVEQVKELGGLFSTTRTADQTEIAEFWANDNPGTYKPEGQLNELNRVVGTQEGNTLSENARMFALTNMAMMDATIAAWDIKYLTDIDLWRPRDAIHEVVDDGNAATVADPTWQPLALTVNGAPAPAFPSYVSGHATLAGAQAAILAHFFGTDNIGFDLTSDETGTLVRHFDSFSAAAQESAESRIYLGVHYQWDSDVGLAMGHDLGEYVFANFLQPLEVVPEPSTVVLGTFGALALIVAARRRQRNRRC